jgi:hypothetical protein
MPHSESENQEEKEESSFLKKRSKRLLFLRQRIDPGHGLDRGPGGGDSRFTKAIGRAFQCCVFATLPA